jgi:DNA-binding transcriptional LysR family regulator
MVFTHEPHPAANSDGLRTTALFDEPLFLVLPPGSPPGPARLADHATGAWIAGCERCREHLLQQCTSDGFTPEIAFSTDDYVTVQSLVAAGVGVSTLPALALTAHRHPDVVLARLPGQVRHVQAATYGDPPDPPAVTALLACLTAATRTAEDWLP